MKLNEKQKQTLTKAQVLHNLIEKHPYLSGMMANDHHSWLDDLIENAWVLRDTDRKKWRQEPLPEDVEELY